MLSFISLNTTFLFCKEQKANCVFLQEFQLRQTLNSENYNGGNLFSVVMEHLARVMILFNRFPGNVINHKSDTTGHWLMVVVEINGVNYILLWI